MFWLVLFSAVAEHKRTVNDLLKKLERKLMLMLS